MSPSDESPTSIVRLAAQSLFGRRIRVHPPESVTRVSTREVPAGRTGLPRRVTREIWDAVVRYYRHGLHPAMALCIRHRGEVIIDRTIGHSHGNGPDGSMKNPTVATPDTPFHFFSSSKSIAAIVIHLLVERGTLALDTPVTEWIPEFGRHGKHGITVRHLLCHQAGIATTPGTTLNSAILHDRAALLETLCDLVPTAPPGVELAYHAITGGFLLGEIVLRATGKDINAVLQEEIVRPLGLGLVGFGAPEAHLAAVASDAVTGPRTPGFIQRLISRTLGADVEAVVEIANDPLYRTAIVPSANVIATPDAVCRLFDLLLPRERPDEARLLRSDTIARATAWQRHDTWDKIIPLPMRYGLGFMLGAETFSLFGVGTPRAFGHLGFTNVMAWADPQRDLSGVFLGTGKPLFTPEWLAWHRVMSITAKLISRAS